MSDKFVGKLIKLEIDGREYRMKSPPSKHIPKLLTLQGKDMNRLSEEDWEIVRSASFDAIKRANTDWTGEEIDEFITENFLEISSKLPVVMGWITEEELNQAIGENKETKKKVQPSPQD